MERADEAYNAAIAADRYFARPWFELALLHFRVWQERGANVDDNGSLWDWTTIPYLYQMAATPPRSPDAWALHSERARVIQLMMNEIGSRLKPTEVIKNRGKIVEATRTASLLSIRPTPSSMPGWPKRVPRSACIATRSTKRTRRFGSMALDGSRRQEAAAPPCASA